MTARATSDSFLLKYFEPADISMMIMAAASLSIVLALFSTYLCSKYQAFGAMQIATLGLTLTLFLLIAVLSMFKSKLVFAFSYMVCEVIVILPMVLFWGMTVAILNPTESKKWFGLIGAAGTCGCILAGYTVSLASKSPMVNELSLGIVSGLLIMVNLTLFLKGKTLKVSNAAPNLVQTTSLFRKFAVLFSGKQSVLMTLLVVCSATALSVIDINFKFEVRKDQEDLYDFFGLFYTYTSIAQLILQLLIVRAILTGGGVIAAITILPTMLIITSLGALLIGSQNAVYVSKFITQVIFFTIEYVGLQMLFLAVSKQIRSQMNSAVDGLTRPATIAIISLLISYTLPFWQGGTETDIVFRLNLVVVGLCACWLFISYLNYKEYLSSLLNMLGSRKLDFEDEREVNFDPKFIKELKKEFLNAGDENAFLLSEFILELNVEHWEEEFKQTLSSGHDGLRRNSYIYLATSNKIKDHSFIVDLALGDTTQNQVEFLKSLAFSESDNKFTCVENFIESNSPEVSCNAATILMNSDKLDLKNKGDGIFKNYLYAENKKLPIIALQALPNLRNIDTSLILSGFLHNEKTQFHPDAIRCINSLNIEQLFPHLYKLVYENHHQALIYQKINDYGLKVAGIIDEKIQQAFQQKDREKLVLLLKFKLESSISEKCEKFESYLSFIEDHPHATTLEIDYLEKAAKQTSKSTLKKWARLRIQKILEKAHELSEIEKFIPATANFETLSLAIQDRKKNFINLLLKLLGILDPVVDFPKLFVVAKEKGIDAKSEVEEVLKGALSPKVAEKFLTIVLSSDKEDSEDFGFFFERFYKDQCTWIYCGLLMAMSREDFTKHKKYVLEGLNHRNFLVRECALYIFIQHEKDNDQLQSVCKRMEKDNEFTVAQIALNQLAKA